MKPLILSFFAVILGYSLFFDNEEKPMLSQQPEPLDSVQTNVRENISKKDSIDLYAKKVLLAF